MNLFFHTLLALMFLVILPACGMNDEKPPAAPVTELSDHVLYSGYRFSADPNHLDIGIQPLWIPTANIIEFIKRDPLLTRAADELGVTLVFHPFLKGNDVNYFLHRGDIELGVGGDMPAISALAKDDLRVISLIQEGSVAVISRGISEVPALAGKRIGFATGSNAHFYLLNTLKKFRVPLSGVQLVPMEVTRMPEAIKTGRIDAFAAWEPTPTVALRENEGLIALHRGKSYGFLYGRSRVLDDHPEMIKHLLAAQIRALRWLRANGENMDRASGWAVRAAAPLKPEFFPSVTLVSQLAWQDLPGIRTRDFPRIPAKLLDPDGKLARECDLLRQMGLIPEQTAWVDIRPRFETGLLESVISNPDRYGIYDFPAIAEEAGRPETEGRAVFRPVPEESSGD